MMALISPKRIWPSADPENSSAPVNGVRRIFVSHILSAMPMILNEARQESASLLRDDPQLARAEHAELKSALLRRWGAKLDLARIS